MGYHWQIAAHLLFLKFMREGIHRELQNMNASLATAIPCLTVLTVKMTFWVLCSPTSCNKCWYTPMLHTVAQFCLISLVLPYSTYICVCTCIYIYTHIHFLQQFLWVLLSISVTFPLLFPSVNPFITYSTEGTCRYPVQLEPLGGVTLLAAVPPVVSPHLGVVPSLVIYKALSPLFLNSGIAHLQMGDIHATAGSSVSCCTTL